MYEKELQRILNASQNNALTFFVGAGVSALSGAPTWKALIHAISDKLGRTRKDEYSSDENLQIPQMFYYSLGENKEEYYRFVKEQLYSASLLPNTIHREMLNLNPVSFITTNYDTLLEDAAVQYCQSFKVVSQDEDVPTIFGDRFILKLHGDFKHNNFVLKEEDYLNYSENFKLIETLVKSIFSTNTVVFIGYSLNDYNIKLILNWTKTLLKGSFREPIFLYVGSSALTDTELIYQQSKGLTVVEWNKLITSTDDYLDRYNAIFAALKNQSKLSLEGKSEDEAFEILYNLLQPLDRLNLHFLLGNGIIADVFSEYRSAVKNLMSLLVYKYFTQGKKVLHEQPFPFIDGNDVYFDEIDFHCFIEYFDAKEIIALLSKYHIETIEFQNMASIENAVNNLLDYYSYAVKSSKNNIDVIGLQTQIKNCLALLRYVSISQGLVDKICGFILTQEFREILINDKVLFLDRQLVHRKMYSKTTSKIVENTLISYLDKHIAALKKGERFELFSASTGINYCNLVHYISAPEEKYYSRRLSMRISQIINNNLSQMYYQITQHYCGYVSKNQQKKLITWANKLIQMNFSFDLFKMLVQCDARISKAAKTQLKVYLKQRIDAAKNKNNNGVVVYPTKQPYEELDQVGYWCLLNVLKAKDFQEFLGNSEAFDFYCEYAKFDFSRFDVSWLLNLYPHTLEQIAKNAKVKERVRVAIATTLDGEAIAPSDSQRLQSILVKHFC